MSKQKVFWTCGITAVLLLVLTVISVKHLQGVEFSVSENYSLIEFENGYGIILKEDEELSDITLTCCNGNIKKVVYELDGEIQKAYAVEASEVVLPVDDYLYRLQVEDTKGRESEVCFFVSGQ